MTTGNPRRSVLVIGASQRVLDGCVAPLRDLGYAAQGTNDFSSDITGRFDVASIDLVSLGHLIPPDRKAKLKEQIGVINPQMIFLPSLAGIPGLIASQVEEAFTADRQDPAQAPACLHAWRPFDPADPRRPGSRQGDCLVADLTYPAGS